MDKTERAELKTRLTEFLERVKPVLNVASDKLEGDSADEAAELHDLIYHLLQDVERLDE